jgi:hypothetical protein
VGGDRKIFYLVAWGVGNIFGEGGDTFAVVVAARLLAGEGDGGRAICDGGGSMLAVRANEF